MRNYRHGTAYCYRSGRCRCQACREAANAACRVDYQRRKQRGPASSDVDEVAVERACGGDLSVPLNRQEMAAALAYLDRLGLSLTQIAARLGVSDRTVLRWRSGVTRLPLSRPGKTADRGARGTAETPESRAA